MVRHVVAVGLLVGACRYAPTAAIGDGPAGNDSAAEDGPVTTDATACEVWTPAPKHFVPCEIPAPGGALVLDTAGTWTYDTDTGVLRDPANQPVPVVRADLAQAPVADLISTEMLSIAAVAELRVVGSKPLVIASWSTIDVAGAIDVSSKPGLRGAGSNPAVCGLHAPSAGQLSVAGGGGGGAGFGLAGATGGTGSNGAGAAGARGNGISPPSIVRGGCDGGAGGGLGGGLGGPGGGAVQLTARTSIAISGRLHASGGGGAGGAVNVNDGGGGGGGSGGWLGLDAPAITLATGAILAANGGGGGGGADGSAGSSGGDGTESASIALGGDGPQTGGDGGADGALDVAAAVGLPGSDSDAGGGGGAGVGFVIHYSSQLSNNALVSPAIIAGP